MFWRAFSVCTNKYILNPKWRRFYNWKMYVYYINSNILIWNEKIEKAFVNPSGRIHCNNCYDQQLKGTYLSLHYFLSTTVLLITYILLHATTFPLLLSMFLLIWRVITDWALKTNQGWSFVIIVLIDKCSHAICHILSYLIFNLEMYMIVILRYNMDSKEIISVLQKYIKITF